ncbi:MULTISPECIES: dCTP deaminase [unclassified Bradyrhizobium]|uniref:dCTP deaminase n=1 Tax=unclassified Bradyrhizobium TaxID=2631580 RepID=UPI0028E40D59|nr:MULTISPECIES: dCTP deaminase [unclassified Bradyrhizobium]
MSALSTEAIKSRLREQDPTKRLVISPLLDQDEQIKPGQASVDVRLGFHFCLVTASLFGSIDEFDESTNKRTFTDLYRREYVPFGASIIIHPHQFFLAQTFEYLRLPTDLMAYVVGRSTWGRLGLIVATAVGIHPSFAGSLTLELRNLGETPLTLYPGQTIAQLFLHSVVDGNGAPSTLPPKAAQYAGTVDMVPQLISSPATNGRLSKLIERHRTRSRV